MKSDDFRTGLLWNFASLAFIGAGGFLLNVLIAAKHGPPALGVFNQVLALYLVMSQACVGGIAFSTLHLPARHRQDTKALPHIVASAIVIVFVTSASGAVLLWLLANSIGRWFSSAAVAEGVRWVAPGLVAFSINKVLFAALNSLHHMRAFAVGQSIRFVLYLGILIALLSAGSAPEFLPAIFTIGEALLLAGLAIRLHPLIALPVDADTLAWLRRHMVFGVKAWPVGLLMDVNTKVDIIMLGYFLDDRAVGLYAFAVLFVDGLAQLTVVVQNSINPLLATLPHQDRETRVRQLVRQTSTRFTPVVALAGVTVFAALPLLVRTMGADASFMDSRWYFAVITVGIVLASPYLPLNMILNQFGLPGYFTAFIACTVLLNVALNAALIPMTGALGAAIATACAFLIQVPLLRIAVRRAAGIHI